MIYVFEKYMHRISSLQFYYDTVKEYVIEKAKKGRSQNRYSLSIINYLNSIITDDEKQEKHEQEVIDSIDIIEVDKDKKTITFICKDQELDEKLKKEPNLLETYERYSRFSEMPYIFCSNILIMLLSRFEEYIAATIEKIYLLYPQKYLNDQQISFSEICDCGIDEVKRKILARQTDKIMRDSYEQWFKLFESQGMSFDSFKEEKEKLVEIYARRNILVHNSGIVNAIYLKTVKNSSYNEGERIKLSSKYVEQAFNTIKIAMYKITIESVRLIQEKREDYLYQVFVKAFEELRVKNYSLTINVFNEIENNKFSGNRTQLMSRVNRWISEIEIHGLDSVKKEIEQFDVDVLDPIFLLAKQILIEEYEEARNTLNKCLVAGTITTQAIKEWPLFSHYRQSEQYNSFVEEHKDIFSVTAYETEQPNQENENKESDNSVCNKP